MKINTLKFFTLAFLLIFTSPAFAQKFGYLNSQALLSELPEVKQADANLQALQAQLEKKGQQMVSELENKYKDLQRKEQSGEISPKALEEEAKKLKEQEADLGKYEQEMQKQLLAKRQETLQPILDKVNNIIKQVAVENQFTYIFDSSAGILLYAQESMDVTALVKTKLGI
ncbi:MAG: OmpH family outer membrane protein [Saprospiraceae bacterium]|nr:OmpH family outer membrane protein [Candidatus Vicinibacter affinis]MBP6172046.1 OmpH family outer membrane protein [Saprospiraceae bacterium]MBK6573214.1 OmpH family outer membrane protein [Candidatus Vicinibacter affinis]MBK6822321.1 OmpH family outer membrane protein [Candidatus Vicinibacter affinis]MBK7797837.1 OmpH family outer membrane protein [Candidatus Vicinibacter affinis]